MHCESALDFTALAHRLGPLAEERGWRLVVDAQTPSTNERVRSTMRAAQGRVPCVAVAATQTAGVGRRGARWLSGPGDGLWFSVAVPAGPAAGVAPPSLALAAELADRLRVHGVPVEVKWPNDLYLGDGKLGGVMLDRGRIGGRVVWLAGVGINWRLPEGALQDSYRPAALETIPDGDCRDPTGLAVAMVATAVEVLSAPERWAPALERLRRRHRWFDQPVEVLPERGEAFRAVGGEIGADGCLKVIRADGGSVTVGPNDRVRAAPSRR